MQDEIDPMFLTDVAGSADLVHKRQDVRAAKDGEVVVTATIESFVHKSQEPAAPGKAPVTMEKSFPPNFRMAQKKDKSGSYPEGMQLFATLNEVNLVDCHTRRLEETGELQVLVECKYFDEAAAWLSNRYAEAWRSDNPMHLALRQYIDADGVLRSQKWRTVTPGERHKFKVNGKEELDKTKEETNIFRKMIPGRKNVFYIQPGAKVKFYKVIPQAWIALRDEQAATSDAAVTDGDVHVKTNGGKVVVEYFAFDCKGGVTVSEDYDPMLDYTERLHQSKNADAHNMVPIRAFETDAKLMPRTAYFYLKRQYQSKWSPDTVTNHAPGVTIVRDLGKREEGAPGGFIPEIKDFIHEYQGTKSTSCTIRFWVYQWRGKPSTDQRYIVKVTCKRDSPLWRKFGITNMDAYAYILAANPALPMHITANVWEKASITHESNQATVINNVPSLENIRGYYIYMASDITPDYLRFFKQSGMRLSTEFVKQEFTDWESTNRRTNVATITLKPLDSGKANPLNERGIMSNVIALGNGFQTDEQATADSTVGINHAYDGPITELFEGKHDFYFLQSKPLTVEETNAYSGTGKEADAFLKELKEKYRVHYWIYAVRKDAKLAAAAPPAGGAAAGGATLKRERPVENDEAEDSVKPEEVSDAKKQDSSESE